MSMDRCTACSELADTDNDDCFYDFSYTTPTGYGGHCENCRDEILEDMTEQQQADHEKRVFG